MPTLDKPAHLPLFSFFTMLGPVVGLDASGECPFCGKGKFYVNVETGQYKCHSENECGASGNKYTLVRYFHAKWLEETTDDQRRRLKEARDLTLQTQKKYGLAWAASLGCWVVPSMSESGEVLNLQRFYSDTGRKLSLPGLPSQMFGLDKLGPDLTRTVVVCEGPWDALALYQHLCEQKVADRYYIVAMPSAGICNLEWLQKLSGRKVWLAFDNDPAGRKGQDRIAKMVVKAKLKIDLWLLVWPVGHAEGCDLRDLVNGGNKVAAFLRTHCQKASGGECRLEFVRGDRIVRTVTRWLWNRRFPFGESIDLSGLRSLGKSTVLHDLTARCTTGLPMPLETDACSPFDVIYMTSEDSGGRVRDSVELHGGDLTRLHVFDLTKVMDDPLDLLERLDELERRISELKAQLVVIDAVNSFVGGDISTDAKARRSQTGRLQALAKRTGAAVIGVRNWGRASEGSGADKALGAASVADVARCVVHVRQGRPFNIEPPIFDLIWEKLSDAPQPTPMRYRINDRSQGRDDCAHHRTIEWLTPVRYEQLKAELEKGRAER